jgi:hypothetical protein
LALIKAGLEFVRIVSVGDEDAIVKQIIPTSELRIAWDLFGLDYVRPLLGLHWGYEHIQAHRLMTRLTAEEKQGLLELVYRDSEENATLDFILLYLRHYRRRWRVWDALPYGLDGPLGGTLDEYAEGIMEGYLVLPLAYPDDLDEVERLLVPGMQDNGCSVLEIFKAVKLWRDFKRKAKPTIRKAATWAAAVDYTVGALATLEGVSQRDSAERYGVSSATVGSKFKDVYTALDLCYYDPRYSVVEDPMADQRAMMETMGLQAMGKLRMGRGGIWGAMRSAIWR